jgi:predicted RNA-binding protein with TRAM domain
MIGRRFESGGGDDRVAPVKVGQELDVKIEGVGEKGDGIAKVSGFVLFVPGVRAGDEVRIKVTRVLNKVGFAELLGRSESSSEEEPEETEKKAGKGKSSDEEDYGGGDSEEEYSDDGEYEDSENF